MRASVFGILDPLLGMLWTVVLVGQKNRLKAKKHPMQEQLVQRRNSSNSPKARGGNEEVTGVPDSSRYEPLASTLVVFW